MNLQPIDSKEALATSALGAMRDERGQHFIFVRISDSLFTGTTARSIPPEDWRSVLDDPARRGTSAGAGTTAEQQTLDTGAAIAELRRLSGLTWEQLARLFGVSRRSLHFWASGKPLNATNGERLRRLLAALRRADRGTAHLNREMLLRDHDGVIPVDLLAAGRYDDFIRLVGEGPRRRNITLKPLSRVAREARKPLPPEQLVGALHDRVHMESGRLLSAVPIRRKREE